MGELLEEGITPLHPRRGKEEWEDAQHVDMGERRAGERLKHKENAAAVCRFWDCNMSSKATVRFNSKYKLHNKTINVQTGRGVCHISCITHFCLEQKTTIQNLSCMKLLSGIIK